MTWQPLSTAPLGCPVQLRITRSGKEFTGTVRRLASGVLVAEAAEIEGMFHWDVVEWAEVSGKADADGAT